MAEVLDENIRASAAAVHNRIARAVVDEGRRIGRALSPHEAALVARHVRIEIEAIGRGHAVARTSAAASSGSMRFSVFDDQARRVLRLSRLDWAGPRWDCHHCAQDDERCIAGAQTRSDSTAFWIAMFRLRGLEFAEELRPPIKIEISEPDVGYLRDGHHRLTAAVFCGATHVREQGGALVIVPPNVVADVRASAPPSDVLEQAAKLEQLPTLRAIAAHASSRGGRGSREVTA